MSETLEPTVSPTNWTLSISCPDRAGIVHAVSGALLRLDANITESRQYGSPDSQQFFLRIEFEADATADDIHAALAADAKRLQLDVKLAPTGRKMRTLIMASKTGHCLNQLLFEHANGGLPIEPVAVLSNHPDLAPMAEFYGVPFHHVPATPETKEAAEAALLQLVDDLDVELVVLARYMQVLSPALCQKMSGRIINIHHSFLPGFKGAKPYQRAHARGVKLIGATAHYVTADLDEGPIIEQDVTRVTHAQTNADFVRAGSEIEASVLARAVNWHAQGRVIRDGQRTVVFA
ncbi:formyltetrahydrofolate deformylase [Brevibacterium sp. 91QC2O2]|uniref:formyltetrahydrofolate deformylase n=1 Tax=Brevibacterium sp. 91QC2O2 TaxID=2968458 RepID=UPI00211BEA3D|nr:formyltetrahydrofolate deformylase [Brevibacterium sp. 91QC2O2]MCQ9369604.1 formyltetrahydrofolate deformylase [Brevibacterium sp. 91QC2O2]